MGERKNAANLSQTERDNFINAVLTLKNTTGTSGISIYDEFVAIHWGVRQLSGSQTTDGGHGNAGFLPWHREYILRFEQALQTVDSSVNLPYWRWGFGSASETNDIFVDDFMGPAGSGSPVTVETGYFAESPNSFNPNGWSVHPDLDQDSHGTALQRNTTLDASLLPPASEMEKCLCKNNLKKFRPYLEGFTSPSGTHNFIHPWVGGHMSNSTSPNDPVFFLHHCNVDRLWAIWQIAHPGADDYDPPNNAPQGHQIDDLMWPWDGGASSTVSSLQSFLPTISSGDTRTPRNVLDTDSLGYTYDNTGEDQNCGCFIATAAYDSELSPPVRFLRDFRDKTILESRYRESFQDILNSYYKFSPTIAKYMTENNIFKQVMKYGIVWPFVRATKTWAYAADRGLSNPRTSNFLKHNKVLHKTLSDGIVPMIKGTVKTCEFIAKHSFAKK